MNFMWQIALFERKGFELQYRHKKRLPFYFPALYAVAQDESCTILRAFYQA